MVQMIHSNRKMKSAEQAAEAHTIVEAAAELLKSMHGQDVRIPARANPDDLWRPKQTPDRPNA
ncbi:MAG: hypothetical protein AB7O04_00820 [Hyphomonadaceae bacterium]